MKSVNIGDRIRISPELLDQWRARPDRRSEIVELVDVIDEQDGFKTLTVSIISPAEIERPEQVSR